MNDILSEVNSSLFAGISSDERKAMLGCIGYHISTFRKGDIIAFEEENIKHIGIVLSGSCEHGGGFVRTLVDLYAIGFGVELFMQGIGIILREGGDAAVARCAGGVLHLGPVVFRAGADHALAIGHGAQQF